MSVQVYDVASFDDGVLNPACVINLETLSGCLPVDALLQQGRPYIRWRDMAGIALDEPFFHQTVENARRAQPERIEFITDINALIQFEKLAGSLRPTGFIFHASRCGSTLVSNACAALPDALVFSEPFVVDKLLNQFLLLRDASESHRLLWRVFLRGAVNALGQRRSGRERHFIVKFAASSALQMREVRRIWPEVPWVFVYRDPVEIIVSNLSNVPDWMLFEEQAAHAAALIGVAPGELSGMSREEFSARALGRFYAEAAQETEGRITYLAYERITVETLVEVVKFFGADPAAFDVAKIERVAQLYSKDSKPRRRFEGDADSKRRNATPLALEMAERWAEAPYRLLRLKHRHAANC